MVIMGAFWCIAINKFTENPRFIHDKKKSVFNVYVKKEKKTNPNIRHL